MGPSVPLRAGVICLWALATALSRPAAALSFDGDLSYTTDYILRGASESAGHSAGQIDLRLTTADGTFAGVFASSLGRVALNGGTPRGWNYKLEEYLGHQFALSGSWSATVTAVNYSYLDGNVPVSNDYQELALSVSYLDLWTLTVSGLPSVMRWENGYRVGRYPAYSIDNAIQYPLVGRLFVLGGVGYYTTDGTGYLYGNAGLAFEYKRLRVEAGWYVAQHRAQDLFPYGRAGNRFAATVLWHF